MKIYTRRGDAGESDLLGGVRALKSDERFCALGDLDELSASLGLLKCLVCPEDQVFIDQIQKDIMTMMAHVAALGSKVLLEHPFPSGLECHFERRIDALCDAMPSAFMLPGVNESSARANLSRTVARRAERSLVTLGWEYPLSVDAVKYTNRLSDYLYALSVSLSNIKG